MGANDTSNRCERIVERRRGVSPVAQPFFRRGHFRRPWGRSRGAASAYAKDEGKEAPCQCRILLQTLITQTNFPMALLMYMHLTFETKSISNINFILTQNNCLIVYTSPCMLMKSWRQWIRE
jgi:hypothetical protein